MRPVDFNNQETGGGAGARARSVSEGQESQAGTPALPNSPRHLPLNPESRIPNPGWRGLLLTLFLWLLLVLAVGTQMSLWAQGGIWPEQSWGRKALEAASQLLSPENRPSDLPVWGYGIALLIAGLGFGGTFIRFRMPAKGAWGLLCASGLAIAGTFAFFHEREMLSFWLVGGAAFLGLLALRFEPTEARELPPSTRRKYVLPLVAVLLFLLPLAHQNLAITPLNFAFHNHQMGSALLAAQEHPNWVQTEWSWTEGTIASSPQSPLHFWPMAWWTERQGLSMESVRAWTLGVFLCGLPILFWTVESLAGTAFAVMTLLFYSLGIWTLDTARTISYVSTSLTFFVLFFAFAAWCIRGRGWLRWLLLGAVLGAGFYFYAPCRLAVIPAALWVGWDFLRERGTRIRLLVGMTAVLVVASTAYYPNTLFPEQYFQHQQEFRREHIFRLSNDTWYMRKVFKEEVSGPFSTEIRLKGGVLNFFNNLRISKGLLLGDTNHTPVFFTPGLAFLGFILALGAGKVRWRRWLLALVFFGLLGPMVAAFGFYIERLVATQLPLALLSAVPLALAWRGFALAGKKERVFGCVLAAILAGISLAPSVQKTLKEYTALPPSRTALISFVQHPPQRPVTIIEPGDFDFKNVLHFATFEQRKEFGTSGVYQWLMPDGVAGFLEDAKRWGLGGTVVGTKGYLVHTPLDALPLEPLPGATYPAFYGSISLERATQVPAQPWKRLTFDAFDYTRCTGCRTEEFHILTPLVALWGPMDKLIAPKEGPAVEAAFNLDLPPLTDGNATYTVLLQAQYNAQNLPNLPMHPAEVLLDGNAAGSWLPLDKDWFPRLSRIIPLGNLKPGRHEMVIRYEGEGQQRLILWNVGILYR